MFDYFYPVLQKERLVLQVRDSGSLQIQAVRGACYVRYLKTAYVVRLHHLQRLDKVSYRFPLATEAMVDEMLQGDKVAW